VTGGSLAERVAETASTRGPDAAATSGQPGVPEALSRGVTTHDAHAEQASFGRPLVATRLPSFPGPDADPKRDVLPALPAADQHHREVGGGVSCLGGSRCHDVRHPALVRPTTDIGDALDTLGDRLVSKRDDIDVAGGLDASQQAGDQTRGRSSVLPRTRRCPPAPRAHLPRMDVIEEALAAERAGAAVPTLMPPSIGTGRRRPGRRRASQGPHLPQGQRGREARVLAPGAAPFGASPPHPARPATRA